MLALIFYVNAEGDCPSGEDRRCLADVFWRATDILAHISNVNAEGVCPAGEAKKKDDVV